MGRYFGTAFDGMLGRSPLRFCFEITPIQVGDLPGDVTAVAVHWEKGSKVSYTEPAAVSPEDGTAAFAQVMRQTATIYKQGNSLLPKHYTFKVLSVKPSAPSSSTSTASCPSAASDLGWGGRRCRTVAQARLDLAQFCSAESSPSTATEVRVPLEPRGTLTLSIKTAWLQHYDFAKPAAQQQQQGAEGSCTQSLWDSSSESNTDKSSVRSSMYGSTLYDTDRNTCSGSAELDRLLQEAEAATAAKAVAPATKGRASPASSTAGKPRVVTLDSLSTAPRGPSRPQHSRAHSAGPSGFGAQGDRATQQQQQQGRVHGVRSVLDVLGGPQLQAWPFHGATSEGQGDATGSGNSSANSSGRPDSPPLLSFGRKWHRRASSVPETPTILEADREELEGGSFSRGNAGGQPQPQQHMQVQQARAEVPLPFGLKSSGSGCDECPWDAEEEEEGKDATGQWMEACRPSLPPPAAAGTRATQGSGSLEGPEALRSLSGRMPTWLWPSSRLAVRDLTTDQIMRRISGSRDVAALQHMCRGLLCERNDWRFRATQAERSNASLQEELQQLRAGEAGLQYQERQQLSEGQLLARLVDAKVQLAQADLAMQGLRGQLERERKRHMQALARLTNMQATLDELIHEQNAAGVTERQGQVLPGVTCNV